MRLPKTKVGDILHCEFWDHSDSDDHKENPYLHFETFGRLVEETPEFYKLAIWNTPHDLVGDENSEYFCIVKKACTKVRVLR